MLNIDGIVEINFSVVVDSFVTYVGLVLIVGCAHLESKEPR